MKKFIYPTMIATAIIFSGCSQNPTNDEYVVAEADLIEENNLIANVEQSELSAKEKAGLILMREEEKLARDVYQTLGDKWGTKIFSNIARSEETHTNAVKSLLDRYQIEDPVKNETEIGKYQSAELQKLYDDLVKKGNQSLTNALIVGATVEDLDIKDLADLLAETDNEDIRITYENLQRGSRNHLRAFVKQIEKNGGTYQPQFISPELYEKIITGKQEKGGGRR